MTDLRRAFCALCFLAASHVGAQEVQYRYDADGRLVYQGPPSSQLALWAIAPNVGSAGTVVYLQGNGFTPNSAVSFNGLPTPVTSVTPGTIVVAAPSGVSTGPVVVSDGQQRATAPQDFIVLPAGNGNSDVTESTVLPLDDTLHSYSELSNSVLALTYHADAGEFVSMDVDQTSCPSVLGTGLNYRLVDPGSTQLDSGSMQETSPTALFPQAITSGTYTVLLSAPTSWHCTLAARRDRKIAPEDTPISLSTTRAFQKVRIAFDMQPGEQIGVATDQLSTSPAGGAGVVQFFYPGGTGTGSYACGYYGYASCTGVIRQAPAGTYAAVLQPYDQRTETITSRFWITDFTDAGTFPVNSSSVGNITRPGQVIEYKIPSTAGQNLHIMFDGVTLGANTNYLEVTMHAPDGTCVMPNTYYCTFSFSSNRQELDLPTLPATGLYSLQFYAVSGGVQAGLGSSSLTLSSTVQGSYPPGADNLEVDTNVDSQTNSVSFDVNDGDNLSFASTDITTDPEGNALTAYILRPDGSMLTNYSCGYRGYASCQTSVQNLPSGRYSVLFRPYDARTKTFKSKFWIAPYVDAGALPINGSVTAAISTPGQVRRYSVSGYAGEQLHLVYDNVTLGAGASSVTVSARGPDGSCLFVVYDCQVSATSRYVQDLPPLPSDGTYYFYVYVTSDGTTAPVGSVNLTLSDTASAQFPLGDNHVSVATASDAQWVNIPFSVEENKGYGIGMTDVSSSDNGPVDVYILRPDGSQLTWFSCNLPGYAACQTSIQNLPAGQYKLSLRPERIATKTVGATIWLTQFAEGGIVGINTTVHPVITVPGQIIRYTFNGTAGQLLHLVTKDLTWTSGGYFGRITARAPDGSCALIYYDCLWGVDTVRSTYDFTALPSDGSYSLYFYINSDGTQAAMGSVSLTLSETATVTIPAGQASVSFSTSVDGQGISIPFTANGGDNLAFALTDVTVSPSGYITGVVQNEVGAQVSQLGCPGACTTSLQNLAPGNYKVVFHGDGGAQTFAGKLWVTPFADGGELLAGSPVVANISKPGEIIRYTFSGHAGDTLVYTLSSLSFGPGGKWGEAIPRAPDGSCAIGNYYCTMTTAPPGSQFEIGPLTMDGTYSLLFYFVNDGPQATTGSGTLMIDEKSSSNP